MVLQKIWLWVKMVVELNSYNLSQLVGLKLVMMMRQELGESDVMVRSSSSELNLP